MFQRLSNSWSLVKSSWNVLQADKELFIFPVISLIGLVLVTLTFIVPAGYSGLLERMNQGDPHSKMVGAIVLFAFYMVSYTVIFYCNTALIGAALIRLRGGNPTMQDGFKIANSHLYAILEYAIIASTVGMLLQWLRDRGFLGRIAAGLFGFAWNIATFLVVPVLVTEKITPINAIKRSTALLKQTWGEQIVGNVGIGLVFTFLIMGTIFLGIGTSILLASFSPTVVIVIAVMTLLAIMVLLLTSSALTGIYVAAVYEFATAGKCGTYFDKNQIMSAFKPK